MVDLLANPTKVAILLCWLLEVVCSSVATDGADSGVFGVLKDTPVQPNLLEHSAEFRKELIKVSDSLHVAVGYGLSNSVLIQAPDGVIVVDTTESRESAREIWKDFREMVAPRKAAVKAVIYTHYQLDNQYGTQGFLENQQEIPDIWSHVSFMDELTSFVLDTGPLSTTRNIRQFGMALSDEAPAFINAGIGRRFVADDDSNVTSFIAPTHFLSEKKLVVRIAGLNVHLLHLPGETSDNIGVWIPEMSTLVCGASIQKSFPNLYNIGGGKSQSLMQWVTSLDVIRELQPNYLLMSHSHPLIGQANVVDTVTLYRDVIQLVHDQSVRLVNVGHHRLELGELVAVSERLQQHPYLQQFTGTLEWSAKAVYDSYFGWFSSFIEDLSPLTAAERATKLVKHGGGIERVLTQAASALQQRDCQWALQLASAVFRLNRDDVTALRLRTDALSCLAGRESNAHARSYYLTTILEDHGLNLTRNPIPRHALVVDLEKLLRSMALFVFGERCANTDNRILFNVTDTNELFSLHMRNGILDVRRMRRAPAEKVRTIVVLKSSLLRQIAGHITEPNDMLNRDDVTFIGDKVFVKSLFKCLDIPFK